MTRKLGGWTHEDRTPMSIDVKGPKLTSVLGAAGAEKHPAAPALHGAS
jgi:hypothetical protein